MLCRGGRGERERHMGRKEDEGREGKRKKGGEGMTYVMSYNRPTSPPSNGASK